VNIVTVTVADGIFILIIAALVYGAIRAERTAVKWLAGVTAVVLGLPTVGLTIFVVEGWVQRSVAISETG
jgi:hypothetical protein